MLPHTCDIPKQQPLLARGAEKSCRWSEEKGDARFFPFCHDNKGLEGRSCYHTVDTPKFSQLSINLPEYPSKAMFKLWHYKLLNNKSRCTVWLETGYSQIIRLFHHVLQDTFISSTHIHRTIIRLWKGEKDKKILWNNFPVSQQQSRDICTYHVRRYAFRIFRVRVIGGVEVVACPWNFFISDFHCLLMIGYFAST